MKKFLLSIIAILFLWQGVAQAAAPGLTPFHLASNGFSWVTSQTNYELGSSSQRIAKIWATSIDTTSIDIAGGSALVPGSVLIAGVGGIISQDNPNFTYTSAAGLHLIQTNTTTGAGTYIGGKYTKFGAGAANNTALASSAASGLEVWDSDNTNVGVQIGVGNSNSGNNAYSGFFWNNDLASDGLVDHYAFAGLNSSTYNNATYGTAFANPSAWFLQNTDGPITFATTNATPKPINFVVGGGASGMEVGRFDNTGLKVGTVNATGLITDEYDALGATLATASQGVILQNITPAIAGTTQNSPGLFLSSNGWGTTVPSSQNVSWRVSSTPVQSTVPTGNFLVASSVAGGAYAARLTLSTAGGITAASFSGTGGIVSTGVNASVLITRTGIAAVSTDGLVSANSTAALVGAQLQWSPRDRWSGTAWNTGSVASNTDDFIAENQTIAGNPTTANWVLSSQINAGGYTPVFTVASGGNVTINNGSLTLGTAGNKLNIATGSNASVGTATLSGGTITVSTTAVTSSSKIFLTDATTGALTNIGTPTVGTVINGTSFVINSSNVLDTSNINWFIIN